MVNNDVCASDTLGARSPFEEHLCRLLDLEPVCVTRLTVDGTFLAVNASALSMLGGERLDHVLGTSLLDLIGPEHRYRCREFLARLAAGERRSAEFELTGVDRVVRPVLLHAAPIPDPHDGIASAVCAWHLLIEQRRLEQAIVQAAASADEQAAARVEESARLRALIELEQRKASVALTDHQQTISDLEARLAELASREQALMALTAEGRKEMSALQEEITRLEAALKEAAASVSQETAGREAERAQFEQFVRALEDGKQHEIATWSLRVAGLEAEVEAARGELERRSAEHAEEIARFDALLARSASEQLAVARQAEQARIARQALEMQLWRTDRLVQAGRLAVSIAGDLEKHFRTVSERVRTLTEATEHGDERRAMLAEIASVAIDGAALAHQIPTAAGMESEP